MAHVGSNGRKGNSKFYPPGQVEAVLRALSINLVEEIDDGWTALCPYHSNHNSPAMLISASSGKANCMNPSCDAHVTLDQMVRDVKSLTYNEALRFISEHKSDIPFEEQFDKISNEPVELPHFDQDKLDQLAANLWSDEAELGLTYMRTRGFSDETLKYFGVGYSYEQNMVTVPMYGPRNQPVGLIGRVPSLDDKTFKNSQKLPKREIPWNLQNAKRYETVIVCESAFDAMKIHQAGFPNVVALLGGGGITPQHINVFRTYFDKIILMVDNDEIRYEVGCKKCKRECNNVCQGHRPGITLGTQIADGLPTLRVRWATFDERDIYPNNVKDATAMTEQEIATCLRNTVSHLDFCEWQGLV